MAYTRLIRAYYHSERGIPDDQRHRLARATTPQQRKAVDAVLGEFFALTDGVWIQKRCEQEIARYQEKQSKASASANARWKKQEAQSDGIANAMRTHEKTDANALPTQCEGNANQEPITNNKKPPNPRKRGNLSAESLALFEKFWASYPNPVAKPKALQAWVKVNPDAAVIAEMRAGLGRWKASRDWAKDAGAFIPHPATWLNQARWNDHPPPVGTVAAPSPAESPKDLAELYH